MAYINNKHGCKHYTTQLSYDTMESKPYCNKHERFIMSNECYTDIKKRVPVNIALNQEEVEVMLKAVNIAILETGDLEKYRNLQNKLKQQIL